MKVAPLVIVSSIALGLGAVFAKDALAKYEEPDYKVVKKDGALEIRQYPPLVAAEVEVDGTGERAANEAFSILAGYIFGKNQSREKIAMTVPVTERVVSEKIAMTAPVTQQVAGERMLMQFFMPSKYTKESLPLVKDSRIKLKDIPQAEYAVIVFSGFSSGSNFSEHESLLFDYIQSSKYRVSGKSIRAFYNPPWTLPFMRRNEVWIPVVLANT